ncbi:Nitrogen regulation protein NIFR3 [Staphylococcus aureus]|nr:Nitrogen regulation protein NIFR3 [Staphylococcus aureus]SGR52088.1 Nitrogen regulation protein NIFR3 [Staphylococcus aureus]SGS64499.1 Nitrogen regulation protein NIFR3 [Staphylococcus aureus]SGT19154.1 Nitrogen regulation protein NIFR3 [Staphylococcus aureus]SGU13843.1 Nitrogen regulation protein NIFR3 [Staphylococcus aureus]
MKMRLQQAFFNSSQGPQHREFRKEILQAMRVGVWAPTQRNWISNFYRQCKLGCGPQQREIGFPISTDNASWRGPNKEKLDSQFLQTMQIGVAPTQKLTKSQLTIMCKLGWDNDKEILFL